MTEEDSYSRTALENKTNNSISHIGSKDKRIYKKLGQDPYGSTETISVAYLIVAIALVQSCCQVHSHQKTQSIDDEVTGDKARNG